MTGNEFAAELLHETLITFPPSNTTFDTNGNVILLGNNLARIANVQSHLRGNELANIANV